MDKRAWIFALCFTFLIVLSNYSVQFAINDYLTWGAIFYPFTFLLGDVLAEKFEKKYVIDIVRISVILAVIPTIFIADLRIAFASLAAFFTAQLLDIHIFYYLKRKFASLWWLRNNASTMISQVIDTTVFFMIAFVFTMPVLDIFKLIIGDYSIKFTFALLDTPFFYYIAIRGSFLFLRR